MLEETQIVRAGRHPKDHHGVVNPPVYHASTILFSSVAEMHQQENMGEITRHTYYGLHGTPTSWAFEDAVAELEGGFACLTYPSGLAAIGTTLLAYLSVGDHLLMIDTVYGPTRNFCDQFLRRFGIQTTYYEPSIGEEIEQLIHPETRVIFTESPGSQTFEMQDIPAITEVAHRKNCLVILDNTWASPLFFKPFVHGVDVSIQAGTKYLVGHSDVMMGTVTTTRAAWQQLRDHTWGLGQCAGPDDLYLAQRGLRTLAVRLKQHQQNALEIADWLLHCPEVKQVLYPALPSAPGHDIWKRDFIGASGLFGIELHPVSQQAVNALVDSLSLFGIGFSWGGYESLVLPTDPRKIRTASQWKFTGPLIRFHIGLESPQDLIADLAVGFQHLRKVNK